MMKNYDRARELVDQYILKNGTYTEMNRSEFIGWIHQTYDNISIEKRNLQPTDMCFNLFNEGLKDFPGPNLCLIYNKENRTFRLVGSEYKYTGDVFQHINTRHEKAIGYWIDGCFQR